MTAEKIPLGLYSATRFAETCRPLLLGIGKLESAFLRDEIDATPIEKPVYIAGLARAGSTTLLETLAQAKEVATHRYSDFPFVLTPYLWNTLLKFLPRQKPAAKERPHKDGIMITPESPEAMEEMLWMAFFPFAHNPNMSNVLDEENHNPEFEAFYRDHIRKLLRVRKAARYVSKGNYNISRLAYLYKIFPDARFIIPVRNPASHVASLKRQHENFLAQAAADARVKHYLRVAGHFEFGPDTRFILAGCRTEPGDWAGYWNNIYRHVHETLAQNPGLKANSLIVRHEDLCADPHGWVQKMLDFCGLEGDVEQLAARIHVPAGPVPPPPPETLETAKLFGY